MNRLTLLGILLLVGSGFALVSNAIKSMMTAGEIVWETITLEGLLGPDTFYWIDDMSAGILQRGADYLVTAPIYLLLLVPGVLLLIIGGFLSK
jgi:hypothetical protein